MFRRFLVVKLFYGSTYCIHGFIFLLQISDADLIKPSSGNKVSTRFEKLGGDFGTLTVPGKREYECSRFTFISPRIF